MTFLPQDGYPLVAVFQEVRVYVEREIVVAEPVLVLRRPQTPSHPLDDLVVSLTPGGVYEVVAVDVYARVEYLLGRYGDNRLLGLLQLQYDFLSGLGVVAPLHPERVWYEFAELVPVGYAVDQYERPSRTLLGYLGHHVVEHLVLGYAPGDGVDVYVVRYPRLAYRVENAFAGREYATLLQFRGSQHAALRRLYLQHRSEKTLHEVFLAFVGLAELERGGADRYAYAGALELLVDALRGRGHHVVYLVDYQDFYLRELLLYLLDGLDAGYGHDVRIEFPAPQPSEILEPPLGQFGVVLLSQTDPVLQDEGRRVRRESLEYAEHDEGLARARRGVDDSATVLYGLVYEFYLVVVEGYPVHALGKPRVEEAVVYLVVPEIDLRPVVPHLGVYFEVFHRRLDLRK